MALRNDLSNVMKEYALQGFRDWWELGDEIRERARRCLENRIVESEGEFRYEIHKMSHDKFFPMPRGSQERQLNCCLFRIRNRSSFELFVLMNDSNSMAFRFEPADEPEWNHNYAHVQFCRELGAGAFFPGEIPSWLPENYPAFPLPSSDPLKLFLAMVTSIHGRSRGAQKLFIDIFQKANSPLMSRKVITWFAEIFDG